MPTRRNVIVAATAAAGSVLGAPAHAASWWSRLLEGLTGNKPDSAASAPPAASHPPAATPHSPAQPASGPATLQGDLLLGQSAVLSGPLGQPVHGFNAGAQLAFDDLNSRGGVLGRRIRLISLDDGLRPETAVANHVALLKEHKVFAFFGCVGSATTMAAEPVLRDSGAPSFGGYAVGDAARLRARGAAYFMRATYGREAQALVRQLVTIGVTRIGVAYLANAGGEEVLRLIGAALGQHKLEPAVSAAVALDGANMAEAAGKIGAMQPQAIIMFLGGPLAASLMAQVSQRRNRIGFYAMSIAGSASAIQQLGDRARGLTLSQVVPYPWSQADPLTLEYRRLAEANQVPVGYFSFEGFLAARVLVEALRRSGPEPSRARLHATLRNLKMNIAGLDLDFSLDGNTGSRFVELVQVGEGGRMVR